MLQLAVHVGFVSSSRYKTLVNETPNYCAVLKRDDKEEAMQRQHLLLSSEISWKSQLPPEAEYMGGNWKHNEAGLAGSARMFA